MEHRPVWSWLRYWSIPIHRPPGSASERRPPGRPARSSRARSPRPVSEPIEVETNSCRSNRPARVQARYAGRYRHPQPADYPPRATGHRPAPATGGTRRRSTPGRSWTARDPRRPIPRSRPAAPPDHGCPAGIQTAILASTPANPRSTKPPDPPDPRHAYTMYSPPRSLANGRAHSSGRGLWATAPSGTGAFADTTRDEPGDRSPSAVPGYTAPQLTRADGPGRPSRSTPPGRCRSARV